MRFSTSLSFMVVYVVIANPLPSWDLPQADMLIGIENKDSIDPDQTNLDFWNIGSHLPIDSPQNWVSQVLVDGFSKSKRPSPLIPKPAPFSVCKDEAYKGFCCDDSMPATSLVRIDCQPYDRTKKTCKKNSNIACCTGMIQRSEIHEEYSDDQLDAWKWKDSMKGGIAQPCVVSDIFPGGYPPYGPDLPLGPAGIGDPILVVPQKCALDCDPDSGDQN